jgi:CRISPR system Cascade subunit CasE
MSYYFSKVQLSSQPQGRELLRSLSAQGDAYFDHALIWRLFPGDGEARDFLFRREREGDGPLSYYAVSQRAPQAVSGMLTVQSKPYAPKLNVSERIRFDLRANPVVTRKAKGGTSRRHDVLMDAKQQAKDNKLDQVCCRDAMDVAAQEWLAKRAPEWGLSVQMESVLTSGYTQHRLRSKGRSIEFSSLDYCGMALVTDPERLAIALVEGVGHARGFGCGLLLVKSQQ